VDGLVQQATGLSNLHATAGGITTAANSRIVTAPVIVEYGLTRRLTLGVVVPLVETRTTLIAGLNQSKTAANVGLNPAIINGDWSQNSGVVSALRGAASLLATQLATCQATPSGQGCQSLLAQQGAAQALITNAQSFASSLGLLYGTGNGTPGTAFVPIAGSDIQKAIDARLARLDSSFHTFGGALNAGTLESAVIPANAALNAVLLGAGYDTLQSPDRSSIGDISIGATYQLTNTFPDSEPIPGFHRRISVNATGRIGTGEPANRSRLFDNPTGYGQPGLVLGAAGDFAWGTRFALSALGSYTMQFGSVDVARVPNTAYAALPLTAPFGGTYSAGNVLSLTALPRLRVAGYFSVNGVFALTRVAADRYTAAAPPPVPEGPATESGLLGVAAAPFGNAAATLQQVGFGFSYSTSQMLRGPGRIPAEVSFRHIETLSAAGGPAAKTFEDQISLRVFVR
jgi:hypothetical protein